MKDRIRDIAVDVFKTVLRHCNGEHSTFRMTMTVNVDGEQKPLLILGNAHSAIEDGHVLAVLNPDRDLTKELGAGVGYSTGLKEIVGKRCDCMVDVWVDAYKSPDKQVGVMNTYQARSPSDSKFKAR